MTQLNMYTPIHKGLRNLLFAASLSVGNTDWSNEADLAALQKRIDDLLHILRLHVHNEETYVHPLLAERLIGVHKKLEAAHREQEDILDDLEGFFNRARRADTAKRAQLGLEFYRVLNRFIALYLPHLDDEEARVMLTMNEVFTSEELLATYVEILRNQAEHDLLSDVDMMFPAMTIDEVVELMQSGPSWMPPELVEKAGQRAERAMGSDRWRQVIEHLGAGATKR